MRQRPTSLLAANESVAVSVSHFVNLSTGMMLESLVTYVGAVLCVAREDG